MSIRCCLLFLLLPAAVVAMSTPAVAISSHFSVGLDGWTTDNPGPFSHSPTGGNTGGLSDGFLKLDNDEGAIAHIIAPAKFRGNLSVFNGGTLSFDGNLLGRGGRFFSDTDDYGWVQMSGPGGTARIDVLTGGRTPPDSAWQRYAVPMTAEAWGKTPAEWSRILENVTSVSVSIESLFGPEVQGIDNFRIAPPAAAVPTLTWVGPWKPEIEKTADNVRAGFGLTATAADPMPSDALVADAFVAKLDVTADTRTGHIGGLAAVRARRPFTLSGCDPTCKLDFKPFLGPAGITEANLTGSFELGNPLFLPFTAASLGFTLLDADGLIETDKAILNLIESRFATEAASLGLLELNGVSKRDVARVATESIILSDGDYELIFGASVFAINQLSKTAVTDDLLSYFGSTGGDPAFTDGFVDLSFGYARSNFFDTFVLDIALSEPTETGVPVPPTLPLLVGAMAFVLGCRRQRRINRDGACDGSSPPAKFTPGSISRGSLTPGCVAGSRRWCGTGS